MKLVDNKNTLGDIWRVLWYIATIVFYLFVGWVIALYVNTKYGQSSTVATGDIIIECHYPEITPIIPVSWA